MTRTQRLQPVIHHTERKQQRALEALARSQAVYEAEQLRLAQLEDYRREYLEGRNFEAGLVSPVELQEFNRFISQLDETIARQAEIVELRGRELEQTRQTWRDRRIDARVLQKAVERIREQELREQERREQKTIDEFCLQRKGRESS